ncbi:MAG: hypothetical protein OEW04_02070 [Nitrospirota bacterium]|nr:hypothetical protein [Nitrospirota bacterium]
MKSKKTPLKKKTEQVLSNVRQTRAKASGAYGDKVPICANTGCALRKKAKCFGFEGCPGFQAK